MPVRRADRFLNHAETRLLRLDRKRKHSAGSGKRLNMLVTAIQTAIRLCCLIRSDGDCASVSFAGRAWAIRGSSASNGRSWGWPTGRAWPLPGAGIPTFLLRLAILPFCPVPLPFFPTTTA